MQTGNAWALQPQAEMTTGEFNNWQTLLDIRSGMVASTQRRSLLQVKLNARMRELSVSKYGSYYQQVIHGACGAVERVALLDRFMLQETQLFRHAESFQAVAGFLTEKIQSAQSTDSMPLWSAGCVSGEEAWSLALCAAEVLRHTSKNIEFGITATDISHNALRKARRATYDPRHINKVPADLESVAGRRVLAFTRKGYTRI